MKFMLTWAKLFGAQIYVGIRFTECK